MAVDTKTIGIPMGARPAGDPRKIDGIAGLEKAHAAFGDAIDSLYDISYNLSAEQMLKNFDLPTIGSQVFDGNSSAAKFIKQFDPENKSGVVGFGLSIVDKINEALDEEKLFKDLFGPQISCLIGVFTDISGILPTISTHFPDLRGMITDALTRVQYMINNALNDLLAPIVNMIGSALDALSKIHDLLGKILACSTAT